ncbi:MAG: hypothetical protein ACRYF3_13590 [Janthinobacterium lividum]
MRTSQLKDAWRRSVQQRKDEDAQREPLDLRTDPHTPTTGTRVWAVGAFIFGSIALVSRGGRLGDPIAPDWVIWSSISAMVLCVLVWVVLYRRAKSRGRTRPKGNTRSSS